MTSSHSLRLLGAAVLLLLLSASAQAQNSRHDRTFDGDRRNRQTYALDQRFRALGGERFHIRGDLHVVLNVRGQRGGDFRITGSADGADLVLTREPDGPRYNLVGSPDVDVTIRDARQRDASDFRTALEFRAVSPGSGRDYRVTLNLRGSARADGTVRAEVSSIQLAPR